MKKWGRGRRSKAMKRKEGDIKKKEKYKRVGRGSIYFALDAFHVKFSRGIQSCLLMLWFSPCIVVSFRTKLHPTVEKWTETRWINWKFPELRYTELCRVNFITTRLLWSQESRNPFSVAFLREILMFSHFRAFQCFKIRDFFRVADTLHFLKLPVVHNEGSIISSRNNILGRWRSSATSIHELTGWYFGRWPSEIRPSLNCHHEVDSNLFVNQSTWR